MNLWFIVFNESFFHASIKKWVSWKMCVWKIHSHSNWDESKAVWFSSNFHIFRLPFRHVANGFSRSFKSVRSQRCIRWRWKLFRHFRWCIIHQLKGEKKTVIRTQHIITSNTNGPFQPNWIASPGFQCVQTRAHLCECAALVALKGISFIVGKCAIERYIHI